MPSSFNSRPTVSTVLRTRENDDFRSEDCSCLFTFLEVGFDAGASTVTGDPAATLCGRGLEAGLSTTGSEGSCPSGTIDLAIGLDFAPAWSLRIRSSSFSVDDMSSCFVMFIFLASAAGCHETSGISCCTKLLFQYADMVMISKQKVISQTLNAVGFLWI